MSNEVSETETGEPEVLENQEGEQETVNNDNTNNTNIEQDDEEDETDIFANIDKDKLDPSAKLILEALEQQQARMNRREIGIEIDASGLNIKHKLVLNRMADNGMSKKEIQKTIADFKEIENASNRSIGIGDKFLSKNKLKTTGSASVKKPLTRYDIGAMLAKKRYNQGGTK